MNRFKIIQRLYKDSMTETEAILEVRGGILPVLDCIMASGIGLPQASGSHLQGVQCWEEKSNGKQSRTW